LHTSISQLLAHGIAVFEDYDCETVGDPQTAVRNLGELVIFLQVAICRYGLSDHPLTIGTRTLSVKALRATSFVHRPDTFTSEQKSTFTTWYKTLFDKNSEGIEDGVLRSTRPRALLELAATLCISGIVACANRRIDQEVLNNGLSYLLDPLLNWTLLGAVHALVRELRITRFVYPYHLAAIRTLVLSESFPRPLLPLVGPGILRLLSEPGIQQYIPKNTVVNALRLKAKQAVGLPPEGPAPTLRMPTLWSDQPLRAIREAFNALGSSRPPVLDVPHCLSFTSATKFLHIFWQQLSLAPGMGVGVDVARELAVHVLATPYTPRVPPLLPIFLHTVFPTILDTIDQQPASSQSMSSELLTGLVSSAIMAALHLERSLALVSGEQHSPLGEPSASMARSLAVDLRQRKQSASSRLVAHRLTSSKTFVSCFPVFKTEV